MWNWNCMVDPIFSITYKNLAILPFKSIGLCRLNIFLFVVLSQTFFMFIHILYLSHRAFVFHPKMLTGVQVRFCWIQLIWMKSFIILTEIWNGLCFIKQCYPPIKLPLQIIIVCPSHWIFRIFLFKHDPQLLLTVPLKKKNSFEFLKIY